MKKKYFISKEGSDFSLKMMPDFGDRKKEMKSSKKFIYNNITWNGKLSILFWFYLIYMNKLCALIVQYFYL